MWPFSVDVARRDADPATAAGILAGAGCHDARAVRTDEPVVLPSMARLTLTMSLTGIPSVMQPPRRGRRPRLENGIRRKGWGNEDRRCRRPRLPHGLGHGIEDRDLVRPNICPPLPGVTPATIWVPYSRLSCVWRAPKLPGNPLHQHLGFGL